MNSSSRSRSGRCFSSQYFGDRHAFDQLHDEVGPAAVGRAGVEHLGDVRMVHHRQGLPLGLEAGDHLPRVHAGLDDLERDRPLERLGLLGHEHHAHAAFADLLQQLVGADDRAGPLGDGVGDGAVDRFFTRLQKRSQSPRVVQQLFHFLAQLRIARRTALPRKLLVRPPWEFRGHSGKGSVLGLSNRS